MLTILGTTINHDSRHVHVYVRESFQSPSGRDMAVDFSEVFDEDVDFDNNENWGNKYIEAQIAKRRGVPAEQVITQARLTPPVPPTEEEVE